MAAEFHTIRERIENKLTDALSPVSLSVFDDSDQHIGHAGHNGKGESHFRIEITAAAFEGKNRVEKHRIVYGILADMIPPIHALQIKADAPTM